MQFFDLLVIKQRIFYDDFVMYSPNANNVFKALYTDHFLAQILYYWKPIGTYGVFLKYTKESLLLGASFLKDTITDIFSGVSQSSKYIAGILILIGFFCLVSFFQNIIMISISVCLTYAFLEFAPFFCTFCDWCRDFLMDFFRDIPPYIEHYKDDWEIFQKIYAEIDPPFFNGAHLKWEYTDIEKMLKNSPYAALKEKIEENFLSLRGQKYCEELYCLVDKSDDFQRQVERYIHDHLKDDPMSLLLAPETSLNWSDFFSTYKNYQIFKNAFETYCQWMALTGSKLQKKYPFQDLCIHKVPTSVIEIYSKNQVEPKIVSFAKTGMYERAQFWNSYFENFFIAECGDEEAKKGKSLFVGQGKLTDQQEDAYWNTKIIQVFSTPYTCATPIPKEHIQKIQQEANKSQQDSTGLTRIHYEKSR